ncbi:hypothetical protein MHK_003137, partial [Candidatus Magnetomorum sp. HK-1]
GRPFLGLSRAGPGRIENFKNVDTLSAFPFRDATEGRYFGDYPHLGVQP